MSRQHLAQRLDTPREPSAVHLDRRDRRVEFLTTGECCDLLRYTGIHRLRSLYRFLARNGVPVQRRSVRKLLIRRRDVEAVIGAHGAQFGRVVGASSTSPE